MEQLKQMVDRIVEDFPNKFEAYERCKHVMEREVGFNQDLFDYIVKRCGI